MRKTRLMQLAEAYGDRGLGSSLTTSTIDGVVYMLAERIESLFGPKLIDQLQNDIALTQSGFSKKKALEIITSDFLENHLVQDLRLVGINRVAEDLEKLPPLSDKTYVDYFVTLTTIEYSTLKTPLAKVAGKIASILSGYSTESPYPVCDGIVQFFKDTDNSQGCVDLVKNLCAQIKAQSKALNKAQKSASRQSSTLK